MENIYTRYEIIEALSERNKSSFGFKIAGYVLLIIFIIVLLQRQDFEVTVLDYILSKTVYIALFVLLFTPFLNIWDIRSWFPFLRNNGYPNKIFGMLLYFVVYILIIIILQAIADLSYSEQAKLILANRPN